MIIEVPEKDKEIEMKRIDAVEVKAKKLESIEYLGQNHRQENSEHRIKRLLKKNGN